MFHLNDILIFLFFGIVAFVIPGTLTVWNIYNCFSAKPKKEKLISTVTVLVGGLLYLMLFAITYDTAGDWYEQVNTMQFHYVISSGYWEFLGCFIRICCIFCVVIHKCRPTAAISIRGCNFLYYPA